MLKLPYTILFCILLVLSTLKTQAGLFDVFFFQLNTIAYKQSANAPPFSRYYYEYYAKDKIKTISGIRKTEQYSRSPTNNRSEKSIGQVKTDSFAVSFNKKGFIKKYLKRFPITEPFHNHYDEPDSIIFDFEYKLTKKRAIVYETINSYKEQTISAKSQIIAYYNKDRICDSFTIINEKSEPEYRRGTEIVKYLFVYNQARTQSYTIKCQNNKTDTIEHNQYSEDNTVMKEFPITGTWCKRSNTISIRNLLSKDSTESSKEHYNIYLGCPINTLCNDTEHRCIYISSGLRQKAFDTEYSRFNDIEVCIGSGIKQTIFKNSISQKGEHWSNWFSQTTEIKYQDKELFVECNGTDNKEIYDITISHY